jgi:hypothetical protein
MNFPSVGLIRGILFIYFFLIGSEEGSGGGRTVNMLVVVLCLGTAMQGAEVSLCVSGTFCFVEALLLTPSVPLCMPLLAACISCARIRTTYVVEKIWNNGRVTRAATVYCLPDGMKKISKEYVAFLVKNMLRSLIVLFNGFRLNCIYFDVSR